MVANSFSFDDKFREGEEEEDDDFCSCCTTTESESEEEEGEFREFTTTTAATASEQEEEEESKSESESESEFESEDKMCLKMFFKGVSVSNISGGGGGGGNSEEGVCGIGVVMQDKQVQKKLDFYVEELVAEYLALMDGLLQALHNNTHHRRISAFTDNHILYHQIASEDTLENQLLTALRDRILEHASKLDFFAVKLIPTIELQRPLQLAQMAVGLVCLTTKGDGLLEDCLICCEEKLPSMMVNMKCSHKFCSDCMTTYVEGKLQSSQAPIQCPQSRCNFYISASGCRSFLPVTTYNLLESALSEVNFLDSGKVYCPFPNCSVLLNPRQLTGESSSSHSAARCVECSECHRFICFDCGVPWHSSMSCEEYQSLLPIEERDAGDITLHRLAQDKKWRRCQQCRRMIELAQGCYHMTCWCGHEFCYSCGAEYGDGQQTCQCAFWDVESFEIPVTQFNHDPGQWAWDSLESLPTIMDAYTDEERSQLVLIQRFLAGGFGLSDHQPYQSLPECSDSHVDTMKDLHQLPWLERFVSVISDNYYEDYIH